MILPKKQTNKMAHLLTTLLSFLLLSLTHAQSPPQQQSPPGPAQQYLDAHNDARAQVGVGPMKWSPNLANMTARLVTYQRLKNNCDFVDLSSSKIKYGSNQMWAQGKEVDPSTVVKSWVREKEHYNHSTNACVGSDQCGVYTQVVWRKTVEVGCAQASCVKNVTSLTICFYNPPGNIVGEKPY